MWPQGGSNFWSQGYNLKKKDGKSLLDDATYKISKDAAL